MGDKGDFRLQNPPLCESQFVAQLNFRRHHAVVINKQCRVSFDIERGEPLHTEHQGVVSVSVINMAAQSGLKIPERGDRAAIQQLQRGFVGTARLGAALQLDPEFVDIVAQPGLHIHCAFALIAATFQFVDDYAAKHRVGFATRQCGIAQAAAE